MNNNKQNEFSKWVSKRNWNFFSTVTFEYRLTDETIIKKMKYFSNHYLIEDILWFKEETSDGKSHIHMVIKTNKILKGYKKLKLELRKLGNTDFRLFDKNQSENVISYISKDYHRNNNPIWDFKFQ